MSEKEEDAKITNEYGGAVEMPDFDITPFIGEKIKVAEIEKKHSRGYGKPYVKVISEPVAYIDEDKEKPVTASIILSCSYGDDKKIVWKKDGVTDNFLKSCGVNIPDELVGKELIMQATRANKDGRKYLTF